MAPAVVHYTSMKVDGAGRLEIVCEGFAGFNLDYWTLLGDGGVATCLNCITGLRFIDREMSIEQITSTYEGAMEHYDVQCVDVHHEPVRFFEMLRNGHRALAAVLAAEGDANYFALWDPVGVRWRPQDVTAWLRSLLTIYEGTSWFEVGG